MALEGMVTPAQIRGPWYPPIREGCGEQLPRLQILSGSQKPCFLTQE